MERQNRIVSLDFSDSTKVTINNDIQKEFEDLADDFQRGNIMIGAMVTLHKDADYDKFMRRVNYLMFNNGGYYLKRDSTQLAYDMFKNGFYTFRVHSYDVKEESD